MTSPSRTSKTSRGTPLRNYYDLGVNDAFTKFAILAMNQHGVPRIPPVTAARPAAPAAPAGQVPNPAHAVSALPPQTMAWKEEPTKPVVGSQPFTPGEHKAQMQGQADVKAQLLGPSVLAGLSQQPQGAPGMPPPYRGRNSYAALQRHMR
jgi:hypothetical protein